jgi:O-antigen/teichoic acid export membrane protein
MLLKNSAIYIVAKAIPALIAFLALSLYTRLLTPEEYGLYTLIFTAAIFTHNTLFSWINMATLRFWSNRQYRNDMFISTIIRSYRNVLFILLIPVFVVLIMYWDTKAITWIASGFILTLALALFTLKQTLFSAKIQPEKYALLTVSTSISTLTLGACLAYADYGVVGIIMGMAMGFVLPSFVMSLQSWGSINRSAYDPVLFKRLVLYGLPLASAAILEEFTKSADRFMLASLQDTAQAGLYAVGYDLSGNSIFMLMTAINLAAYPVIIKRLETEGKQSAYAYFNQYTLLLLGVAIPAVMGLILVGSNIVYLLIGAEYQHTVILLLPWISIALLLLGLQVFYFDLAFQLGDYPMGIVHIGIVIAITNLALNYWLIPWMGMQGAAIATISSFALGSVLSFIFGRRYFALPFPIIDFLKISAATLLMGVSLWSLRELHGWGWLIVQLAVGIASYTVGVIALNIMGIRSKLLTKLSHISRA